MTRQSVETHGEATLKTVPDIQASNAPFCKPTHDVYRSPLSESSSTITVVHLKYNFHNWNKYNLSQEYGFYLEGEPVDESVSHSLVNRSIRRNRKTTGNLNVRLFNLPIGGSECIIFILIMCLPSS